MEEKMFPLLSVDQVVPYNDMLFVEVYSHGKGETKTKSGIIIPDNVHHDSNEMYFAKGRVIRSDSKDYEPGNYVLFSTAHGVTLKLDNDAKTEYRLVPKENVFAILKKIDKLEHE